MPGFCTIAHARLGRLIGTPECPALIDVRTAPDFEADPSKHYVGMSPEECRVIRFACAANMSYFNDECGCGCQDLR